MQPNKALISFHGDETRGSFCPVSLMNVVNTNIFINN